MEESGAATQGEAGNNTCVRDSAENQTNGAAGEVSSQVSEPGPGRKSTEEPGARYNRLKLFDKVMQKSLEKLIEHASFNRFASMFCPLYKKNPQRMESIHKQFIEELQKAIQDDTSRLIEEGQLEVKLNELDKLERAAKKNPQPAWRPSGVPEQDLCSFMMPYYQKQEAYMRLELKKIQAENAALAQKVQAGRESIAQTENCISEAVDEWKASVTEFEKLASSLCPADVFDV
ncbi:polyamine-modulated factor 1 [Hippoglossus hippoglossus]|uniref:polyamine-modulated factor 1 n=1 Tax=Hippoglossus hippoglossus TaxID=8267 RepID=UPI00148DD7D7|nr:polyamine-modulated factor 1 [Hippoglossus hippoglossus]